MIRMAQFTDPESMIEWHSKHGGWMAINCFGECWWFSPKYSKTKTMTRTLAGKLYCLVASWGGKITCEPYEILSYAEKHVFKDVQDKWRQDHDC